MIQERHFQIIDLLIKTLHPMTAECIAKEVSKSKRTVMRDLSTIKDYFEEYGFGEILVSTEPSGYSIKIIDPESFEQFRMDNPNDAHLILYQLLIHETITLDELSEYLYISKVSVTDKIRILKHKYPMIDIQTGSKGHFIQETLAKKCLILANLIEASAINYYREWNISNEMLEKVESFIQNNPTLCEFFPNLTTNQIMFLFIASLSIPNSKNTYRTNEEFARVYELLEQPTFIKAMDTLIEVSDEIIEINININERNVETILEHLVLKTNVDLNITALKKQIYLHLKRVLSYPTYISDEEVYNIGRIKGLYPLSFDLSMMFINDFEALYGYNITNKDLMGLYFTVEMTQKSHRSHRVIIYSVHNALATINQQTLETSLHDTEVIVMDSVQLINETQPSLVINTIDNYTFDSIPTLHRNYILNESDVSQIKEQLENTMIERNSKTIFPQNYSFTYYEDNSDYRATVKDICFKLLDKGALTHDEVIRIINREKQGNSLIIGNYLIPHCISSHENRSQSVYIHLKHPIEVEGTTINHLLVTVMSPSTRNNMNVFKYLYRYLNQNMESLKNISEYEEFIQYMEED